VGRRVLIAAAAAVASGCIDWDSLSPERAGDAGRDAGDPVDAGDTIEPDAAAVDAGTDPCVDTTYIASVGFSATQGANRWSYLSTSDLVTYTPAVWVEASMYWISAEEEEVAIARDAGRAAEDLYAVRRWTAPCDGTVTVSGDAHLLDPADPESNGEYVMIRHGGATLWGVPLAEGPPSDASYSGLPAFAVVPGDPVDFVIGSGNDDNTNEWVVFDPTVAFTPP
jgi:hypothetical protein